MIRFVKWETDWLENEQTKGSSIILFNRFSISKGQWDGFMFSLEGLGFSKSEKLLGLKRSNKWTLYFLKWYFSYNKNGYEDNYRLVSIVKDLRII